MPRELCSCRLMRIGSYVVHKTGERKVKSKSAAKMDQALARAVKAVVTVNRELHASASDRSCRHIELDLKGRGVQYSTGDHIAILARNRHVTSRVRLLCACV
jgi:sulfite reductase alpha subunit-like flavoprotein